MGEASSSRNLSPLRRQFESMNFSSSRPVSPSRRGSSSGSPRRFSSSLSRAPTMEEFLARNNMNKTQLVFEYQTVPKNDAFVDFDPSKRFGSYQDEKGQMYDVYLPANVESPPLSYCSLRSRISQNDTCRLGWQRVVNKRGRDWYYTYAHAMQSHVSGIDGIYTFSYKDKSFVILDDTHRTEAAGMCNADPNDKDYSGQVRRDSNNVAQLVLKYAQATNATVDFFVEAPMMDIGDQYMTLITDEIKHFLGGQVRMHNLEVRFGDDYYNVIIDGGLSQMCYYYMTNKRYRPLRGKQLADYQRAIDWMIEFLRLIVAGNTDLDSIMAQLLKLSKGIHAKPYKQNRIYDQFDKMLREFGQRTDVERIFYFITEDMKAKLNIPQTITVLENMRGFIVSDESFFEVAIERKDPIVAFASIFDMYALARLIRNYYSKETHIPQPVQNAFILAGNAHTHVYKQFMNTYNSVPDHVVRVRIQPTNPPLSSMYLSRYYINTDNLFNRTFFYIGIILDYIGQFHRKGYDRKNPFTMQLFLMLPTFIRRYLKSNIISRSYILSIFIGLVLLFDRNVALLSLVKKIMYLINHNTEYENILNDPRLESILNEAFSRTANRARIIEDLQRIPGIAEISRIPEEIVADLTTEIIETTNNYKTYHDTIYPIYLEIIRGMDDRELDLVPPPLSLCYPVNRNNKKDLIQPFFTRYDGPVEENNEGFVLIDKPRLEIAQRAKWIVSVARRE